MIIALVIMTAAGILKRSRQKAQKDPDGIA